MFQFASMSGVSRVLPPKATAAVPRFTGAVPPTQLFPLLQRSLAPAPFHVWPWIDGREKCMAKHKMANLSDARLYAALPDSKQAGKRARQIRRKRAQLIRLTGVE